MILPRLVTYLAVLAWLMGKVVAADVSESNRSKSGKIADLPATASPVKGQLSLIADYAHEEHGFVWVYLVNATDAPVSVPSEDGEVYSKRESPDAQGHWMRCDWHVYNWCGNSYEPITISSGDYYGWRQLLNSQKGEIKPVRFRLYNREGPALISNEGKATIDPAEIERCRYDAVGLEYGPFEDVEAVALGKVPFSGDANESPRLIAIKSLGRFREDPRFFDTMTEITKSLWQAKEPAPKDRTSLSEELYFRAMLMLTTRPQSLSVETRDRIRDFLIAQFKDQANPWPRYAFLELSSDYKKDPKVRSLIVQILDSPQESVFPDALYAYAEFTPKRELLARLSAMETESKYSPANRSFITKAKEEAMRKSDSKEKR